MEAERRIDHAMRLQLAVGEYLEAVDRLAALRPAILGRRCGSRDPLDDIRHAAESLKASLHSLRRTYSEVQAASAGDVSQKEPPHGA